MNCSFFFHFTYKPLVHVMYISTILCPYLRLVVCNAGLSKDINNINLHRNIKHSTEQNRHRMKVTQMPSPTSRCTLLTLLSHCEMSCNSRNSRLKLASKYYRNSNSSSQLGTQCKSSKWTEIRNQHTTITMFHSKQIKTFTTIDTQQ